MYTCSRRERQHPERQTHEITACEISATKETNMGQRDRMTDVKLENGLERPLQKETFKTKKKNNLPYKEHSMQREQGVQKFNKGKEPYLSKN